MNKIFDDWPEHYERWFQTPIGRVIHHYESLCMLSLLKPREKERILDAGCGSGIFTKDILAHGARVVGLDLSLPMLTRARDRCTTQLLCLLHGDMLHLPFPDTIFDKAVSITALEFISDAQRAVDELFRVTRPGGYIVVATLNSLSPWADRRRAKGREGHSLFKQCVFRSPDDIRALSPVEGRIQTMIHFQKNDDPDEAIHIEAEGTLRGLPTGAFIIARWEKPLTGHG